MESRKITIISTKSNKRTVINTDATTLGELKKALREAGVDYGGMTFYEGLTKTELKLDESLLPHDVQRINPTTKEPETTNELAFMLTNINKKIRSGASTMSRTEAYAAIKAKGLQDECVKRFGKNFTMCKTADLISLVESKSDLKSATTKPATTKTETPKVAPAQTVAAPIAPTTPAAPAEPTVFVDVQARAAIKKLVDILEEQDTIISYEAEEVLEILDGEGTSVSAQTDDYKPSSDSPYSDDELDAMFKDIPM